MEAGDILSDITGRIEKKTIHELRQIARAVGVVRPADGKKERLINDILSIATCKTSPSPRSARGAPPKSSEYDRNLVADIEKCMRCYGAGKKDARGMPWLVSDGNGDSSCAGLVCADGKKHFLLCGECVATAGVVNVHDSFMQRFNLSEGDRVVGEYCISADGEAGLCRVLSVNGSNPDALKRRAFSSLTPAYPDRKIELGGADNAVAVRETDLFAPIGRGQRGLVLTPAGVRGLPYMQELARGISAEGGPETVVILLSARPEDVTAIKRGAPSARLCYTTFGMDERAHAVTVDMIAAYARSCAECGKDIAVLADGARGENLKKLFTAAINAEEGGSVTVLATCPEEEAAGFAAAANMRLRLKERGAAGGGIDIAASYTDECALLQTPAELSAAAYLRGLAADGGERVREMFCESGDNRRLVDSLKNG